MIATFLLCATLAMTLTAVASPLANRQPIKLARALSRLDQAKRERQATVQLWRKGKVRSGAVSYATARVVQAMEAVDRQDPTRPAYPTIEGVRVIRLRTLATAINVALSKVGAI